VQGLTRVATFLRAVIGAGFLACFLAKTSAASGGAVFAGVDTNYSLGMEKEGRSWSWDGKKTELFRGMADQGVRGLRVRLWTADEGQNGKLYATEVVKRALAAGLEPYLVIFLSEDWADLMKQPLPAVWKNLDAGQLAEAVRVYSRDVVRHFREAGLRSHLYEIGNEIDYGICGVYPGKSTKKNPESLSRSCWPEAAKLILASQQGVKEADPEATFLLHIAHWWDVDFCTAFFRFMLDQGVQVDFAGLSYFPSSNIGGSLQMEQFGKVVSQINRAIARPVIVPETAYPSTSDFSGQFSRWKKEVPGYPLTPDGQRRWLTDFLNFCAHHPGIDSVYYWSPEWSGEGMWKAFALFDVDGNAKPAWQAFAKPRADRPEPKTPAYFEIRDERLYPVPVEEAERQAGKVLAEKLKQAGRVNVEFIKAITDADLSVAGYRVNLRASLSGNLDLALKDTNEPADGAGDWKSVLKEAIAAKERLVLFVADESSPLAGQISAYAKENGTEAVLHVNPVDKPLKFGMGNAWQDASTEE